MPIRVPPSLRDPSVLLATCQWREVSQGVLAPVNLHPQHYTPQSCRSPKMLPGNPGGAGARKCPGHPPIPTPELYSTVGAGVGPRSSAEGPRVGRQPPTSALGHHGTPGSLHQPSWLWDMGRKTGPPQSHSEPVPTRSEGHRNPRGADQVDTPFGPQQPPPALPPKTGKAPTSTPLTHRWAHPSPATGATARRGAVPGPAPGSRGGG